MQLPAKRKEMAVEIPQGTEDVFDLKDNMEGVVPRLPQISIVHQAQMFKMPDEEKLESFEGVVLDQQPANAYWSKAISETSGGAMPDCFSLDGITPVENCNEKQAEACKECPQNEFGSDERGKGKACKNMKRLHIIMEDSILPRRLTIPPTSIRAIDEYLTRLVDQGLPYRAISTKFSLKKIEGEFEYSGVICEKGEVLKGDELVTIANFVRQYKEGARAQEIRTEEYINKGSDTSFDTNEIEKEQAQPETEPEVKKKWFGGKKGEKESENGIPF